MAVPAPCRRRRAQHPPALPLARPVVSAGRRTPHRPRRSAPASAPSSGRDRQVRPRPDRRPPSVRSRWLSRRGAIPLLRSIEELAGAGGEETLGQFGAEQGGLGRVALDLVAEPLAAI